MKTWRITNLLLIALLLFLATAGLIHCRKPTAQPAIHPHFLPDSVQSYFNGHRLFFMRHIDTLYTDTLYSVCYLSPQGDTIRARLPFHYEHPDTTIWVNFYLRNNGDTLICDDHSELVLDSLPIHSGDSCRTLPLPSTDISLPDSITHQEQTVISEIQQYLKDYQQLENKKQHEASIKQI